MRFDLFKIFLVSVLAFAIAFTAAPWFAFRALQAATAAEDIQATADLVDFPAVRKSLSSQLAPESAPDRRGAVHLARPAGRAEEGHRTDSRRSRHASTPT